MELSVVGNLLEIVQGKRYIGSGLYKDEEGLVWTLRKVGDDWIIERVASKTKSIVKNASVMFRRELIRQGRLVDLIRAVAFLKDEVVVKIELAVDDNWVRLNIKLDPVEGGLVVGVEDASNKELVGKSEVIPVDVDVGRMDLVKMVFDMVQTEEFIDFVCSLLFEGGDL